MNTDPAMKDVTEWINRSVGQHKRRISEGTESSRRLIGLPVYDSMTPEPHLLHRVDASQLDRADKARFTDGTNRCDLPIEMIEPIPSVVLWAEYLKTAALVVVAGLVLAATLYASTK